MTWWWIAEVNGQRRGTMRKHPNLTLAMLEMFGCMVEGFVFRASRKRDAMKAMAAPLNEQWQYIYRENGTYQWGSEHWCPGMKKR